jgi:hypothetical protein
MLKCLEKYFTQSKGIKMKLTCKIEQERGDEFEISAE